MPSISPGLSACSRTSDLGAGGSSIRRCRGWPSAPAPAGPGRASRAGVSMALSEAKRTARGPGADRPVRSRAQEHAGSGAGAPGPASGHPRDRQARKPHAVKRRSMARGRARPERRFTRGASKRPRSGRSHGPPFCQSDEHNRQHRGRGRGGVGDRRRSERRHGLGHAHRGWCILACGSPPRLWRAGRYAAGLPASPRLCRDAAAVRAERGDVVTMSAVRRGSASGRRGGGSQSRRGAG